MGLRRVVTAHDKNGRAVIASDTVLPANPTPGMAGWSGYDVWAAENSHFPDSGERPQVNWFFPPVGGFHYIHSMIEPQTQAGHDAPTTDAERRGPTAIMTAKGGQHRSASIDTVYVIAGSVMCELDDGVTFQLNAGDTLIQCGAIHAWSNPFSERCHIFAVMIGAEHDLVNPPAA